MADVAVVWVVDDDARIWRTLRRVLGLHQVHFAPSLERAMQLLDGPTRYDAILADLSLAGDRGTALVKLVQRHSPQHAEALAFMTAGDTVQRQGRVFEEPFSIGEVRQFVADRLIAKPTAPPVSSDLGDSH